MWQDFDRLSDPDLGMNLCDLERRRHIRLLQQKEYAPEWDFAGCEELPQLTLSEIWSPLNANNKIKLIILGVMLTLLSDEIDQGLVVRIMVWIPIPC